MFGQREIYAAAIALSLVATVPAGAASSTPPSTAQAVPAIGATVPAPVVMVIDTDRIMNSAKAMKGLQGQIDTQRQAYQKEFSKKEDELRATGQELQKDQAVLSAEAFEEKRHSFEKHVAEVQKEAQTKRQSLDQGAGEAVNRVKKVLLEVVQQLADERHANLVLQSTMTILYEPAYDASEEALHRLDQKLPSVQLVLPKVAEGGPVTMPVASTDGAQPTPTGKKK